MNCPKCKIEMVKGKAIENTLVTGIPDFPGSDPWGVGQTLHPGGPGKLIDCLKCPQCGFSKKLTEKGTIDFMEVPTPDGYLYRITAPHFCAGIVRVDGVITEAAPILSYMTGWPIGRVRRYCEQKGWVLEWVRQE